MNIRQYVNYMVLNLRLRTLSTEEDVTKLDAEIFATMQAAYDRSKRTIYSELSIISNATPEEVLAGYPRDLETGVDEANLRRINEELLDYPEDFNVFGKLERILKRREEPFKGKGKIDWAHAETLAFGAILQDGNPIRIDRSGRPAWNICAPSSGPS